MGFWVRQQHIHRHMHGSFYLCFGVMKSIRDLRSNNFAIKLCFDARVLKIGQISINAAFYAALIAKIVFTERKHVEQHFLGSGGEFLLPWSPGGNWVTEQNRTAIYSCDDDRNPYEFIWVASLVRINPVKPSASVNGSSGSVPSPHIAELKLSVLPHPMLLGTRLPLLGPVIFRYA